MRVYFLFVLLLHNPALLIIGVRCIRIMKRNQKIIIYASPLYIPLASLLSGICFVRIEHGPLTFENLEWIAYLGSFLMFIGLVLGIVFILLEKLIPKYHEFYVIACLICAIFIVLTNTYIITGAYII